MLPSLSALSTAGISEVNNLADKLLQDFTALQERWGRLPLPLPLLDICRKVIQWLVNTSDLPLRRQYLTYTKHYHLLYGIINAWQLSLTPPEALSAFDKLQIKLGSDFQSLKSALKPDHDITLFRGWDSNAPVQGKVYYSPALACSYDWETAWDPDCRISVLHEQCGNSFVLPVCLFACQEHEFVLMDVYIEETENQPSNSVGYPEGQIRRTFHTVMKPHEDSNLQFHWKDETSS